MAQNNEEDSPLPQLGSEYFQHTRRIFIYPEVDFNLSTKDESASTLHEGDLVEGPDISPNIITIVAFLLSVVSGAFTHLQYRLLKPEPDGRTEALLHAILLALNPDEIPAIPPPQEAPPDGVDVAIILFKTSFSVSVFAAVFALEGDYLRHKSGAPTSRRFNLFFKCITLMVLIALALLFCGLGQRIWYIDSSVAYTLAPLAVPGVGMYLWMAIVVLSV